MVAISHDCLAQSGERRLAEAHAAELLAAHAPDRDLFPEDDPGAVEGLEQRRMGRVVLASKVGADGVQLADDVVAVCGCKCGAVGWGLLVEAGAAQRERAAVQADAA